MQNSTIDFYVDVIDNFGDLGFAVTLGKIIIAHQKKNIRIFSNDKALFLSMINNYEHPDLFEYLDVSEIIQHQPSELIFNFFDRKIDFGYLNSFGKQIYLLNFGYFLLHQGIESLHGTKYQIDHVSVEHIIPSLLKNTGGILIGDSFTSLDKIDFFTKIKNVYNLDFSYSHDDIISTIFVYPQTLDAILKKIELDEKNTKYFIFGYPELKRENKNIIIMPFLSIEDYDKFLSISDYNIVRGENSFIQSVLHSKPTLWDIYKENNNAHVEKINDYLSFLSQFSGYNGEYERIMKDFNGKNIEAVFSDFSKNYENFQNMFQVLGKYIHKECNLYQKIKKHIS